MIKNSRFETRLENIPGDIWALIAQIDELKGRWIAGGQLNPQVLSRLKQSVLITSTGASTRIEGAKLNDEEIEGLMRGLSVQKFTDRDVQEVKGYFELLKQVFDNWQHVKLSENTIKHFHQELLKYVEKDIRHRGEYKNDDNKVVVLDPSGKIMETIFQPTSAYLAPKEMQELTEWTDDALKNQLTHPLLIIGNFIVEFLKIHPLTDGNGRLSRILTNLLLLKQDYSFVPYVSHEKLIEDNKPAYYLALRQSQKTFSTERDSIVSWLKFFLEIMLQHSKMALELLSQEAIERLLSPKQLAVWHYILQTPEATPGDISSQTKIARPTVNQALTRLLKLRKIERIGLGRSTRYRTI